MKKVLLLCLSGFLFSCGNKPAPDNGSVDDGVVVVSDDETQVFVRRDVYTMAADDPVLVGYKTAIRHMQGLPDTDPTSWTFQAAIHGTYASGDNPVWNQCQHGSFFFISWHRMYLYYFERIVRKYSNNSDWALPYWNYSTATTRSIPATFRDNNGDNPLYVSQRYPSMNAGARMSDQTVSLACLEKIPFTGTPSSLESFGGQTIPAPQHFFSGRGALENVPHNQVHNAIGGWMQDPNTAAQDPIFWVHHSNIDRLWNTWISLGDGRYNTDDEVWLTTSFPFYDENGTLVELTGAEILNSVSQLDYRYESDPEDFDPESLFALNEGDERSALKMKPAMTGEEQEGKTTLAQTKDAETKFTQKPLKVNLTMETNGPAAMKRSIDTTNKDDKGVYLTIEGVKFDEMPNKSIGIFINVPEGTEPDYNSPHFVDLLTFFGVGHHGHHHGEDNGSNFVFRIDDNLTKLSELGIDISSIEVSFHLTNGVEPLEGFTEEATDADADPKGSPRFRKITIQSY